VHSVWQCCRYRTNKQHKGGSGWLGMMLVSRMPLHSVAACCMCHVFTDVNKSDRQLNLPTTARQQREGGGSVTMPAPLLLAAGGCVVVTAVEVAICLLLQGNGPPRWRDDLNGSPVWSWVVGLTHQVRRLYSAHLFGALPSPVASPLLARPTGGSHCALLSLPSQGVCLSASHDLGTGARARW